MEAWYSHGAKRTCVLSGSVKQRHVDHLREWVPAHVINASPSVVTALASDHAVISTHRHLLRWLKSAVTFLMNNCFRSTLMQNHHTVNRRFCLLVPRRTPSQQSRVVTIPGTSVSQLTDMDSLIELLGNIVLYLALSSIKGERV